LAYVKCRADPAIYFAPAHPNTKELTFAMKLSSDGQTSFQHEVTTRFGLVPNFFASAPDAPEIVERLWDFVKSAYIDNPIPSLFKERLFVYLSRFCEVRYCIVRHGARAFLTRQKFCIVTSMAGLSAPAGASIFSQG
jgi:hypothetical protein